MIRQLEPAEFTQAAEVIRASFLTVAHDLGLTEENCPKYVGFVTTAERLQTQLDWGWWIFGLFEDAQLIGYVSISKLSGANDAIADNGVYEIHNLSVLPERRHKGYGKQLLDFCISEVRASG